MPFYNNNLTTVTFLPSLILGALLSYLYYTVQIAPCKLHDTLFIAFYILFIFIFIPILYDIFEEGGGREFLATVSETVNDNHNPWLWNRN